MSSERFEINGIAVKAMPLGNGMYIGVPENPMLALAALLSGDLLTAPRVIRRLPAEEPAKATFSGSPNVPGFTPAPAPAKPLGETITQYRARTGMSRTQTADLLNVSRRTLGRWELKGKRMAEV